MLSFLRPLALAILFLASLTTAINTFTMSSGAAGFYAGSSVTFRGYLQTLSSGDTSLQLAAKDSGSNVVIATNSMRNCRVETTGVAVSIVNISLVTDGVALNLNAKANVTNVVVSCQITLQPTLSASYNLVVNVVTIFGGAPIGTTMVSFDVIGPHFLGAALGTTAYYANQWLGGSDFINIPFLYSGSVRRSATLLGTSYFQLKMSASSTFLFNDTNIQCYLDYRPLINNVIMLGLPSILDAGLSAQMYIPIDHFPSDPPDLYPGTFICSVPWRSTSETTVPNTAFTLTAGINFSGYNAVLPTLTLDTVASDTKDWQVLSNFFSPSWTITSYGIQGAGSGYIQLGLKRISRSEMYRGA